MFFKFAALVCLLGAAPSGARELTDGQGTKVKLADQPARIVTLAPSLGELAADFAGERLERIVGVSEFTDYPPYLKTASITSVGPYTHVSIEKVVSLKPDLVLATVDGNARDQILHLRELGLPVVVVDTETLAQIGESMKLVGSAMGNAESGERMAAQFREGLGHFRERAKGRPPRKVLLELSDSPFVVVGKGSFVGEALGLLGAANVYESSDAHYPRPAFEDAVSRNPDVIVMLTMGTGEAIQPYLDRWKPFRSVPAVKDDRIRVVEPESLLRPTLRFLEGLTFLETAVYGQRR